MSELPFALIPFPAPNNPELVITGMISRKGNLLSLHYLLTGMLENIRLPCASSRPGRKDELWKTTCFEFFLAIPEQPEYWEFNLSPSGDWNGYHMDGYRRVGFREETRIEQLSLEVQREMDALTLSAAVDLNPVFQWRGLLQVGITAVIQANDDSEAYWALTHPGSQADFHSRESFTLLLAEQTHRSRQSALHD